MSYLKSENSLFNPDVRFNTFIQTNLPWAVVGFYVMFTKVIGPKMMQDRKPFNLKLLILIYNVILTGLNAYFCCHVATVCMEVWPYRCDVTLSPLYKNREKHHFTGWLMILIKYGELLDTVFFTLRKKFNQITFLHVFHHCFMALVTTTTIRYDMYGYYQAVIVCVNAGVHVLLYLYYALSALGPNVRKYLWWKKYLTVIQITQFFFFILFMLYSNLHDCGFQPTGMEGTSFIATLIITTLFLNFYLRTYK